jgi:hypothetical protein
VLRPARALLNAAPTFAPEPLGTSFAISSAPVRCGKMDPRRGTVLPQGSRHGAPRHSTREHPWVTCGTGEE